MEEIELKSFVQALMMKSEKKFMRNQIRKAMRYAANLPKLKARNSIYLKLQEVEKKYKNE